MNDPFNEPYPTEPQNEDELQRMHVLAEPAFREWEIRQSVRASCRANRILSVLALAMAALALILRLLD